MGNDETTSFRLPMKNIMRLLAALQTWFYASDLVLEGAENLWSTIHASGRSGPQNCHTLLEHCTFTMLSPRSFLASDIS